jgi:large subunit ribosomal protein L28
LTLKGKKGKMSYIAYARRSRLKENKESIMVARCELTGKGKQFGNNVSFSLRRTNRVFKPNLQKKTFMFEGQKVTMVLSTQAIRTLKKKGILSKNGITA